MRAIASTLEISRSNLREQLQEQPTRVNRNVEDKFLLPLIKEIIDAKPTYGYRRVTVLLNRKLRSLDRAGVNHKRIYRIMKENDLLLMRYGKKPTQTHDGAMIRDLMVEAVEKRFGKVSHLPIRVQWLSDNGPCYTSHETVNFGRMLGFDIRTTPSYSPESNGMAEALVKTTKRDYAWFADLSCAEVLMGQVPSWFEDYNENAPHKGLGMKSPREFRREQLAGN